MLPFLPGLVSSRTGPFHKLNPAETRLMRILFSNPLWLLGALIAVPLLAHLFSRARPRRRDFPSLRLLREGLRRGHSIKRPRDRWLLLLRTLAIAALVLAFLQPLLLSRFASDSGAART